MGHTAKTESELSEVSFKEPYWRDVPSIFILLIFSIGLVVIAAIDLRDYNHTKCFQNHFGDPRVAFFDPQISAIFAICILLTFLLSGLYYCFAAMYTDQFIRFSMIFELCVSLGTMIFYMAHGHWLSGTSNLIWLILSAIMYWALQRFVNAATLKLEIAMQVAERNPSMLFISFLGALFAAAWSILVGSVALAGFGKVITEECSIKRTVRPEGEFIVVLVYLCITNYIVTEAVKAVVRVAICYTYGWWCFMPRRPEPQQNQFQLDNSSYNDFPSIPYASWSGLLAGVTYSFGSVCLSSIWLALLKVLNQILAAWSQTLMVNSVKIKASEDISSIILVWVSSNCTSYMDSALAHFSNYVLVFIAVDNDSYLEGFKQAGNLIINQGTNAVITDLLAGGTLTFGSWCVGMSVGSCAYIYMQFIQPYPHEGIFFICSYIVSISVQICGIMTTGISSGVQTSFVAVACEPERIREVHPRLYSLSKK